MTNKSEDYWNTSLKLSFNFDDDEVYNKEESLESSTIEDVFSSNLEFGTSRILLPMHAIISKRNLDSILGETTLPSDASVPIVQDTISNMFLGRAYTLHVFRSLDHKLELLDEAVVTEDGNIILTVILYLKKSLKFAILLHHLSKRKIALQHYVNYLKWNRQLDELADVYICKDTLNKENIHKKLLQFLAEHQVKLDIDNEVMFANYKTFIKWQIDANMDAGSVMQQLAVLQKYEMEKERYSYNNILLFKQLFKINDFQYEWVQLNCQSAFKMWKTLTELFIKPNWLTKRNSIKSTIDSELFISTLHKHDAPTSVLEAFLSNLANTELALTLGIKFYCYKFVIDVYGAQRDRTSLSRYKITIPPQSEESLYAENMLRSIDKRSKN